jgi:hypothetical protein
MGAKRAVALLEPRNHPLVEIGFAPGERLQVGERLDFSEGEDVVKR